MVGGIISLSDSVIKHFFCCILCEIHRGSADMAHFSLLGFIGTNFAMFRDALVFSELQLNCKRWWFSETMKNFGGL